MLKKVLVANRGEIAVRILRACRELGLRTVAVYSEVDRGALHVRYADESYLLGPPPPRESYLCSSRIIEIAQQAGADAIHPGYGFLSENAAFARACCDAGLVFVGPSPEVLEQMGNKVSSRRAMQAAGIPVVPGTMPGLSDQELEVAARSLGFPLLVKAAFGGGGKGMRIVASEEQLPGAIATARREAEAAFGDGTVYLERIISGARHIEFQILADAHGNIICLGDRECSIQRRYQKLVEEAPAVGLTDALRCEMAQTAIRAAREVGYTNAGTVEFLLDTQGEFYFLEMNTRLQVEHCVTEAVTGVDIVREQLRIAGGRKLRLRQEDVRPRGWAIECRVTAEDPYNNFLPSIGRISGLYEPTGPGVRVDSGVYEGFQITPYYDSLIAKLVTWGETRAEAILRMRRALEEYRVMGVKTTIPFFLELMNSPRFLVGQFDTTFAEANFAIAKESLEEHLKVAAIAATLLRHRHGEAGQPVAAPAETPPVSKWKMLGRWQTLRREGW